MESAAEFATLATTFAASHLSMRGTKSLRLFQPTLTRPQQKKKNERENPPGTYGNGKSVKQANKLKLYQKILKDNKSTQSTERHKNRKREREKARQTGTIFTRFT